jgi:lysine N6-hydroxylase
LRFVENASTKISLLPGRAVHRIERESNQWMLVANQRASNHDEIVRADVVIWATGFRKAQMDFLEPLRPRLTRENDEFRIDSDFAAVWDGPEDRHIFLLNAARHQRGLSDPNLSLTAWRSQRVIDRIRAVRGARAPQLPSFIAWSPEGSPAPAERKIV